MEMAELDTDRESNYYSPLNDSKRSKSSMPALSSTKKFFNVTVSAIKGRTIKLPPIKLKIIIRLNENWQEVDDIFTLRFM